MYVTTCALPISLLFLCGLEASVAEHSWKITWWLHCDGGGCNVVLCACVSGIEKWLPPAILRLESSLPTNLGQHCSVLHQKQSRSQTVASLRTTTTLISRCKDFLNRHTKHLRISCVLKRKLVALCDNTRVATNKVDNGETHGTKVQL